MKYKEVQFISWEVYTGPFFSEKGKGYYPGLTNLNEDARTDVTGQCLDIMARVAFTRDAIEKAHKVADRSGDVLKLFIAPEFLYRGHGGAYLHDLINGWEDIAPKDFGNLPEPFKKNWSGLFGELKKIVHHDDYKNWMFVFGTALSASFPAKGMKNETLILDISKPGEIYNTALVQMGGKENQKVCYASRKHYKSGIDFLKETIGSIKIHTDGTVKPLDPESLIPLDRMGVTEGGALFQLANVKNSNGEVIDFGLEICLDHLCSGGNRKNDYGRIRTGGKKVQIQLVPSGGANLEPESVWLKNKNSYAINCDGMNGMKYAYSNHTQVWSGSTTKLFEASGGEDLKDTESEKITEWETLSINNKKIKVSANELWNSGKGTEGSGHVRILKSLPL